jgi:UDP-N-acetylglucosamine 4,6-dehydratase/5-epimerase
MFKNKTLMITGGTGSFGGAVLEYFIDSELREIRIFSRDEKKQEDVRLRYRSKKLSFVVGDVRDRHSINAAMRGVDYLFQAAALKQVPTCEFFPIQAVKTNILGSDNVLEAAIANCVKRTVVLSTDKAVYPINTMGMTKAIMEKLAQAKARDQRLQQFGGVICATRYGNVMCSRGSVIPLFIQQIKAGQELTITDPSMTRFMMSLNDSVELVLKAFCEASPGDIFVQKSPAATIGDLVDALLKIFEADNDVRVIGARHGEKMYETLCGTEEMAKAEDLGRYYRIPADGRDMNYSTAEEPTGRNLTSVEQYNSNNTRRLGVDELMTLLLSLDYVQAELRTTI